MRPGQEQPVPRARRLLEDAWCSNSFVTWGPKWGWSVVFWGGGGVFFDLWLPTKLSEGGQNAGFPGKSLFEACFQGEIRGKPLPFFVASLQFGLTPQNG